MALFEMLRRRFPWRNPGNYKRLFRVADLRAETWTDVPEYEPKVRLDWFELLMETHELYGYLQTHLVVHLFGSDIPPKRQPQCSL
jgi:hypothetical protein